MVKSVLYTASAGAGKTTCLTHAVLDRLKEPNRIVVASTFTRAAAAEMSRRLLAEIMSGKSNGTDPSVKLGLIMRASKTIFATIDSLFHLFLSTESYVPQVADSLREQLIIQRTNEKFLHHPFLRLNPHLVSMATRILGITPERLPWTLYDEKKAFLQWNGFEESLDEIKKRHEQIVAAYNKFQKEVAELAEATRGNLRNQVVEPLLTPLPSNDFSSALFLKEDISEVKVSAEDRKSHAYARLKELYPQMRRLAAEYLVTTQKLRASLLHQFASLYTETLSNEKKAEHRLFFEDITRHLLALDPDDPDRPVLMGRLYVLGFNRVSDFFLDEFQDTSRIQMDIFSPLLKEMLSTISDTAEGDCSLFFVGDWKQSIYQWRDADPGYLRKWLEPYRLSGQISTEVLPYNWRSTPLLIGFFNNIVPLLYEHDEEMRQVRQKPPPPSQRIFPYSGRSEVAVITVPSEGTSDDAWYARLVEEVRHLHEKEGIPFGDIVILCRTNDHIAKVSHFLSMEGIAVTGVRGREVLSTREGTALFLAIGRAIVTDREEVTYLERGLTALGYEDTLLSSARSLNTDLHRIPQPHRFSILAFLLDAFEPSLPRAIIEAVWEWGANYFARDDADNISSFLSEWVNYSSFVTVPETEHSNRVKVSTIHGVKGLEFPHVILFWKKGSEKASLLLHPTEYYPLSLNKEKREFLATNPIPEAHLFSRPYEIAHAERSEETANLVYVAVTRAKQSLTVVLRANREGKVDDFFSTAMLTAAKQPIENAHRTEYGWWYDYGHPAPPVPTGRDVPRPRKVPFLPLQPSENLDPSLISAEIESAITRGIRIHRALSTITSDGNLSSSAALEPEEKDIVERFLKIQAVRNLLLRPGMVRTEQHLSDTKDFGIVDRIIVENDRVTLIDYKTGNRVPTLLEEYREQIGRYRQILASLFPDRRIEAYLLFVDDEKNPIEPI